MAAGADKGEGDKGKPDSRAEGPQTEGAAVTESQSAPVRGESPKPADTHGEGAALRGSSDTVAKRTDSAAEPAEPTKGGRIRSRSAEKDNETGDGLRGTGLADETARAIALSLGHQADGSNGNHQENSAATTGCVEEKEEGKLHGDQSD